MRCLHSALHIIVFAAALTGSAVVVSADATGLPRSEKAGAASRPSTRVETDQEAGVIRFIVKGREEARLDATGLHVRQGITYGNSLADIGKAGYSGVVAATGAKP